MYKKKCEINGCKFNIKGKCYDKDHTYISCGNIKNKSVVSSERRTPLSNKILKAYKLHVNGKSFLSISKVLNCSKSTAHNYVKKAEGVYKDYKGVTKQNDKPISIFPNDFKKRKLKRLHNDVVSFLIEPIDFWGEPNIIKLKYTKYLLIKKDNLHIQLFENKLVVRFLEDISCRTIKECRDLAKDRIIDFLKGFNYKGVRFKDDKFEQVSRHYAIVGTALAKKFIREKKKFFVFDEVDGKRRLVIDYSKKKAEFEGEHNIKGFSDSEKCEAFFDDLINKPFDLPSEGRAKLDFIVNVQKEYAEQIKKHLLVQDETLKTLKAIRESLKK